MAKAVKVLCDRCEQKIVAGVSFCGHCGYPTRWASHEERTQWEVAQWKTADREKKDQPARSPSGLRRLVARPFARKAAPEPEWHLSLVKAPVGVPAAPEPMPELIVAGEKTPPPVKPAAKAAPRPQTSRPAPKVATGPRDGEPITDEPATVLAVRLLNARVRELDERVQQLERELAQKDLEHSLTS